jgi:hypothetical protein
MEAPLNTGMEAPLNKGMEAPLNTPIDRGWAYIILLGKLT